MRSTFFFLLIVSFIVTISSCDLFNTDVGPATIAHTSSLHTDRNWSAGFSDYPTNWEDKLELEAGYRSLPSPLDTTRTGFYLSGSNDSDDLFMFIKRRINGFQPGKPYQISFDVRFATEEPSNCAGIGGAPGESVFVKGGASPFEPHAVIKSGNSNPEYRMNVDKGNQKSGGVHAVTLGHIANSRECEGGKQFELKTLQSRQKTITVKSNADGKLWIFAGTDSGFEGRTRLYFTRIKIHAIRQ